MKLSIGRAFLFSFFIFFFFSVLNSHSFSLQRAVIYPGIFSFFGFFFLFYFYSWSGSTCVFFFVFSCDQRQLYSRTCVDSVLCMCTMSRVCGIYVLLLFLFVLTYKFVQRVTVVKETNFEADFVCCVLCQNRAACVCKYVVLMAWHPRSGCTRDNIRSLRRFQTPYRSRTWPEVPAACWTLCYAVSFYPWSSSASWPRKGQDHKGARTKEQIQRL